jgi:hypothetical protein
VEAADARLGADGKIQPTHVGGFRDGDRLQWNSSTFGDGEIRSFSNSTPKGLQTVLVLSVLDILVTFAAIH